MNTVKTNYYTVSVVSTNKNVFHDLINTYNKAIILEAEIGKPMWFCYYVEDDLSTPWHRIKTSNVETIDEVDICLTSLPPKYQHQITVMTENSLYTFTR